VSDQRLRHLERKYLAGDLDVKELDKACKRHGAIGPTLADACNLLARIFPIASREDLIDVPSQYTVLVYRLRNMHYLTPIDQFEQIINDHLANLLESLQENFASGVDHGLYGSVDLSSYIEAFLPLYLAIPNIAREHPLVTFDGIEGVIIDRDTPKELADRLAATEASKSADSFNSIVETLEEGHVEIWIDYFHKEQYESAAELLPDKMHSQLKEAWENYPQEVSFGDFLKNQYPGWFESAIREGYESYVYGEMWSQFEGAIDELQWHGGTRAKLDVTSRGIVSTFGSIILWIPLSDLKNYFLQSTLDGWLDFPLYSLLEDGLEEGMPHFDDRYYGEDEETIRQLLLDSADEFGFSEEDG
jgi:hypothetical protein